MAVRRRHAIGAWPDSPDDAAEALARRDAHVFDQRTREPALAELETELELGQTLSPGVLYFPPL